MVYISLPKAFEFAFFFILLLINLCGSLGRIRVRHTCISFIAKSNNGSIGEKYHTFRSRCACVWKCDDHDYSLAWYDSFSTFYLRAWLCFSPFFLFQYVFIAHASFARIVEKDHAWKHRVFIWWKWKGMFLLSSSVEV